ncbi:MAG: PAS domain S-box protein [Methanoregula sp.]|nr:PAS domain S-box protein [Methanoregula sp.]
MEIRKKTILIITFTLLGLIIVLFALSEYIILGGFTAIEQKQADSDINRVVSGLSYDLVQMDTMGDEWKNREDIINLFRNPRNASSELLITDQNFESLQYNVILLSDMDGKIVAGRMYDINARHSMPVQESLLSHLVPENQLYRYANAYGVRGIIMLPEGPMLVSLRWITLPGKDNEAVGSILFGRYLDQQVLMQISALTNSSIEMYSYNDANLPQDVRDARDRLTGENLIFLKQVNDTYYSRNAPVTSFPINESTIVTYTRINDIYESPALLLRVALPREIYTQGRSTTASFIFLFFVAWLSFGIVILLLLETTVLSRVTRLSGEVSKVGKTGDCSIRVSDSGNDELGHLAGAINWMLKEIEAVHARIKTRLIQSEERYRIFFNSSNDIVFVFSMSGAGTPESMIEINDAGCQHLGYTRDEFLARSPGDVFNDNGKKSICDLALECTGKQHCIIRATFVRKDKSTIPVEIYAHIFHQLGRPAVLAVCHDITERIENEKIRDEAFSQIGDNMEKFAILNDHIRNPLQIIIMSLNNLEPEERELVVKQVAIINGIINRLDMGYLESEKIRNFLKKHCNFNKKDK